MEFLTGRMLTNALMAVGIYDDTKAACAQLGADFEALLDLEADPGLGNGGLGRLAACFLDSIATLGLPGMGYGIRYDYGMFAQRIVDGQQVEEPDGWLVNGNPWEFMRPEFSYPVRFGGRLTTDNGHVHWVDTDDVIATAYDSGVPGYELTSVATLRLWSARASSAINLAAFNKGDYIGAVEAKNESENVSRVLYPDDSTEHGRELRLRQEYFFVSASLQDLLRRYLKDHGSLDQLADKVAIHLNDTHPALAVPELMRLLVDEHRLDWDTAWALCGRIFSYTNHTLMQEALETWPVDLMGRLLPRHLRIIYDLNARFLAGLHERYPGEPDLLRRVSLIDESGHRRVRMASLCVLASHKVNGVSALHSELMVQTIFADFARLFPERFCNKTNGITPRRWLAQANQPLAKLIDDRIGRGWRRDLDELAGLRDLATEPAFNNAVRLAKQQNKRRLADYIARELGIRVEPESLFDVQVKRMHEYKRQLLNVLHVITRYHQILANPHANWVPRTVDLRRQGRVGLPHGQAGDPADQRRGAGRQRGPARRQPAQGGVHPELPGHAGRDDHPGGRPVGADLHRRHRGLGHRQHEVRPQRRADHRHLGRREHRDRRTRGPGQHLHLRQPHRAGGRVARPRLPAAPLLRQQLRAQDRDRPHRRRRLLARRTATATRT